MKLTVDQTNTISISIARIILSVAVAVSLVAVVAQSEWKVKVGDDVSQHATKTIEQQK